jgi:Flp pilus assembly protein TadG
MQLARLVNDVRGGVTPLFAIASVAAIGFVGAAVDYSRANSVKAAMQAALDATALNLSKNAGTLDGGQLQSQASGVFNALFQRPEAQNLQVTPTYVQQTGNSTLTVSASAVVKTDFLSILGQGQMNVGATTQVKWGNVKLRVALALDNTGSMASNNKMTMLKSASHQLLTTLENAASTPGDVEVAIIPFATDVNIGTAMASQTWIDWSYWSPNGSTQNGLDCDENNSKCGFSNHSSWNGCVMDRSKNYDTLNSAPVNGTLKSYFPADQSDWCPQQLMTLTHDWTALHDKIDAMTPSGNTNQTIGLVWAWHALTSSAPLNAPPLPDNTQPVIILLTDGMNTQNRFSHSQSSIDKRTEAVCDNIKADPTNIQVYTVLVMAGNSSILKDCASKPGMYVALTTADQILMTFNQIGTDLAKLRLSK